MHSAGQMLMAASTASSGYSGMSTISISPVCSFLLNTWGQTSRHDSQSVQRLKSMAGTLGMVPGSGLQVRGYKLRVAGCWMPNSVFATPFTGPAFRLPNPTFFLLLPRQILAEGHGGTQFRGLGSMSALFARAAA
jgi:hypothetical protein